MSPITKGATFCQNKIFDLIFTLNFTKSGMGLNHHNRFPTTIPMSIRLLQPKLSALYFVSITSFQFPRSVLFLSKPPMPLGLESFIHLVEMSNIKAILMFRMANLIPIYPMNAIVGFVARPKEVSFVFSPIGSQC